MGGNGPVNWESIVFPWVPVLWVGGWIAASIVWRRKNGKPIVPRAPAGAAFSRSWISGASHRDFFSEMGGARGCLMVAVTADRLIIRPNFPFNLMFLPDIYDLEHDIPRTDILSAELRSGLFGPFAVITFRRPNGGIRTIDIRSLHVEALIAALRA